MSKRRLLLSGLFVALLVGYFLSKIKLDEFKAERKSKVDIRVLPNPKVARILSIGFDEALADVFWVEGINYYGAELGNKHRTYKYLPEYCDLILNLDPFFKLFYEWAGTAFIYHAMKIERHHIVDSTRYVNRGIQTFHNIHRYDAPMILKAAFNYAMEAQQFVPSLPYFLLVGRAMKNERDMLLVASTYASYAQQPELMNELKLEYLAHKVFEAEKAEEVNEAFRVLTSGSLNSRTAAFARAIRVKMEKDEELQKLVQRRLEASPIVREVSNDSSFTATDLRFQNLLTVDRSKSWMPTELFVLISL